MIDILIAIISFFKKAGLWIFQKTKSFFLKDYNHISSFILKHPLKSFVFLIVLLNFAEAFIVSSYKQQLGSRYYWNYQSEHYGEMCLDIMIDIDDKTIDSNSDFDIFKKLEENNIDINLLDYFLYVDNEEEYKRVLSSINKAKDFCAERVKKISDLSANKWFIPAFISSSMIGIEVISPNLLPLIDLRTNYEFYIFAIILLLPYIILNYCLIKRTRRRLYQIVIFGVMTLSWLGSFAPFFIFH